MKRKFKKNIRLILLLILLVVIACALFMTWNTYGNWEFALKLRGKKMLAFLIVGVATCFATISFQTVTENHFLTPNILGLDSLYILIQTFVYFFYGGNQEGFMFLKIPSFLFNVGSMVLLSSLLFMVLLRKGRHHLYLVLMIGMVLGTFFRSASTFLQVMMDPNEYDKLQGKLFASFNTVDSHLIGIAAVITLFMVLYLWHVSYKLDVLHLGKEQAMNLGISVDKFQIQILGAVSTLVAISTSLVGPVTFLGFIVANLTYQIVKTYQHRWLFLAGSLLSVFLLVFGQFIVEQVFGLRTTLSVVIEFVGGMYFVWKILHERKQNL